MKTKVSAKITSIEELREHALKTIQKLGSGQIDTDEAGVTGKLYEGVIASVKLQLEYHKMTQTEPDIAFLGNKKELKGRLIEGKTETKPKKLSKS